MLNEHYLKDTLKNLKPLEVFDYFDGPRFYSCISKSGQLYLVFWVDETENASSWLYVQISHEKYSVFKMGKIAIRESFLHSEEGYVFLVTVDKNKEVDMTTLSCHDIPLDYLPEPDDFLDESQIHLSLDTDTIKAFIESLKSSSPQLELSEKQQAELHADIQTIATQQTSPNPKAIIIIACLRSIQRMLESMIDHKQASGFLKRLGVLMG
jgi:hypothetical protein